MARRPLDHQPICGRAGGGSGGHRQQGPGPLGVHHAPLQHLHAAHRSARHEGPALDAEVVGDRGLRADHVADRDDREPRPPRPAVVGVGRRRAGRALAAAEHIHADDEEAVGVERPPWTDQGVPPPRLRVAGDQPARGVAVAGQRVADEHGVAGVGRQRSPGLVRDGHAPQQPAALEGERPLAGEGQEPPPALGVAGTPRAGGGQRARVRPPEADAAIVVGHRARRARRRPPGRGTGSWCTLGV